MSVVTVSISGDAYVLDPKGAKNKITQLHLYRNGLSAYQIAVSKGFIGTEQDFVDGLVHPEVNFLEHYNQAKI